MKCLILTPEGFHIWFEIPLEDCPTQWVTALARSKRVAFGGGGSEEVYGSVLWYLES